MEDTTKDLPKWLDPYDPDRTFAQRAAFPTLFVGAAILVGVGGGWVLGNAADRFSRLVMRHRMEEILIEED